jgi:hypothetical protein
VNLHILYTVLWPTDQKSFGNEDNPLAHRSNTTLLGINKSLLDFQARLSREDIARAIKRYQPNRALNIL